MKDGLIFTMLLVSIVFGLLAHKRRKENNLPMANVHSVVGLISFTTAVVGMS